MESMLTLGASPSIASPQLRLSVRIQQMECFRVSASASSNSPGAGELDCLAASVALLVIQVKTQKNKTA
jgi:hypothetical protein